MINIKRLNNLLSHNGYQKFFPLDFEEQLNNKNYDFNFKINEVLKQIDKYGFNPLIYILSLNKDQKLGFDFNTLNKLYEQQIDKKYEINENFELSKFSHKKQNILFNEEYILNKLKYIHNDLIYVQEFLNYRKALLEKQKITNVLTVNQVINNIVKI